MIEVLAVIAIIAILAALIFPVYGRAKDSALRSDDMAAMNQLRTALQLYYADQGAYPPQLLGYATLYTSGPNIGQLIPADQIKSYMFPKRVSSIDIFQSAKNQFNFDQTTTAVYPARDSRPLGTPVGDLNGDGVVSAADDDCGARQLYGPGSGLVGEGGGIVDGAPDPVTAVFYKVSGYDVAEVPDAAEPDEPCDVAVPYLGSNGKRFELRYTLFWTEWGLGNGNAADDPRQLGYGFPPDDTIITWNSYFRNLDRQGKPVGSRDIVLFLGGSAKMFGSNVLAQQSWRAEVTPSTKTTVVTGTKVGPAIEP